MLNKDFSIIFFGKIIQVFIMVSTIKVSTSLLNPEEMGNLYLFLTIQTFFVLPYIASMNQYINRNAFSWYKNKVLYNNTIIFFYYVLIIALISCPIGYILYYKLKILNQFSFDSFIILLFSFIIFTTTNQTISTLLNMLHYRISYTIIIVLSTLMILLFGYLLIIIFEASAVYWLYGILISNIIFTLVGFYIFKTKLNSGFKGISYNIKILNKRNSIKILRIVFPISIATLFMWLQNRGYRIIVEQNISLEFLGYLGIGLSVATQIASTFESIMSQYLEPIYYKKIALQTTIDERTKSFNWLLNIKLPVFLLLTIYISIFAPEIVKILVDDKYKGAYFFTIFGIWIELFRMITNVFYTVSLTELKTKHIMFPYAIGALATTFLLYFASISNKYEFYVPISLVIGGIIVMLVMYFYMKKIINFKIDYRLLFYSLIISLPYLSIVFFNVSDSIYTSLAIIVFSGLYFIGTIIFIYKKGLGYGYN